LTYSLRKKKKTTFTGSPVSIDVAYETKTGKGKRLVLHFENLVLHFGNGFAEPVKLLSA